MSSKLGTSQTFKARFWPWLEPSCESPSINIRRTCSLDSDRARSGPGERAQLNGGVFREGLVTCSLSPPLHPQTQPHRAPHMTRVIAAAGERNPKPNFLSREHSSPKPKTPKPEPETLNLTTQTPHPTTHTPHPTPHTSHPTTQTPEP